MHRSVKKSLGASRADLCGLLVLTAVSLSATGPAAASEWGCMIARRTMNDAMIIRACDAAQLPFRLDDPRTTEHAGAGFERPMAAATGCASDRAATDGARPCRARSGC